MLLTFPQGHEVAEQVPSSVRSGQMGGRWGPLQPNPWSGWNTFAPHLRSCLCPHLISQNWVTGGPSCKGAWKVAARGGQSPGPLPISGPLSSALT